MEKTNILIEKIKSMNIHIMDIIDTINEIKRSRYSHIDVELNKYIKRLEELNNENIKINKMLNSQLNKEKDTKELLIKWIDTMEHFDFYPFYNKLRENNCNGRECEMCNSGWDNVEKKKCEYCKGKGCLDCDSELCIDKYIFF